MAIIIKAKIYKIVSDKGDRCYIGSTTKQYLSTRWSGHTSDYRRKPNKCASKEIFDEYGVENCRCELIEEIDYKTKEDYLIRERYWIENTPHCINIRRKPIASSVEQKVKRSQTQKKLYEEKKIDEEWMANRRRMTKEWRDKVGKVQCNCGKVYTVQHEKRHLSSLHHRTQMELIDLKSQIKKPLTNRTDEGS